MSLDSEDRQGPNWWVIGIFTAVGAGLLALGYYMSSYWQGVLVNGGTALLLFAMLAFAEPRLVRHLRAPRTAEEALARFASLVAPFRQDSSHPRTKDRVLRLVARTGLHQDPPASSSANFRKLDGSTDVNWCVEWDDAGLRHIVTVKGRAIPPRLGDYVGWDEPAAMHEDRIYKILCYLLDHLEPSRPAEPHS